ncbi:MAG: sulfurtransferase [Burkholderiales bacterium]|jgi:rhodanese-related sulfurtransferase|nr:sulfurtransferase [Burkholderiales bacterium]
MHKTIAWLIAAWVGVLAATGAGAQQKVDPAKLPEEMRTKLNLYLMPREVPGFIKAQKGKVLFIDVRTRAEAGFVGMAEPVDALVPYVEFQEFMSDWDETRGFYKLEPFSDFAPEVERRLKAKGMSKTDPVILMCRSGERAARGADLLAQLGYTRVYSVVGGFEGPISEKTGRRDVAGWKNAGLPWSYELDKAKMYFPR